MTTVTLIGAGSAEFTAELVTQFLSVDTLADGEFTQPHAALRVTGSRPHERSRRSAWQISP